MSFVGMGPHSKFLLEKYPYPNLQCHLQTHGVHKPCTNMLEILIHPSIYAKKCEQLLGSNEDILVAVSAMYGLRIGMSGVDIRAPLNILLVNYPWPNLQCPCTCFKDKPKILI